MHDQHQLAKLPPQTTIFTKQRKKKNIQLYETNLETQSRAYLLACHSGLQGVVLKHKPVK